MFDEFFLVKDLTKYFPVVQFLRTSAWIQAVNHVNLSINEGECFGLIGESGCGKTTLGRTMLNLIPPTSGEIFFKGQNILQLEKNELKEFRKDTAIVFQDPFSSLNPRMKVIDIIGEPLDIHDLASGKERVTMIGDLMEDIGLRREHIFRFPHEFSGGQRQRIAVARALITQPKFIILDEPTSALDVSVQAKILNLLKNLQSKFELTYLFISHNINVVQFISQRMGVMYLGDIVEIGPTMKIMNSSQHPYTQALLSAVPQPNPDISFSPIILEGEVPTPLNPPSGCRFHPRCPYCASECEKEKPTMVKIGEDHYTTCHRQKR